MVTDPKDTPSIKAQFDQLSRAEERLSISEKIKFLEGQVSANKNQIAELTQTSLALSKANPNQTSSHEKLAHAHKSLDQTQVDLADASSQLAALADDKDASKT